MLVEVTKNNVKILQCEAINQGEYNVNKCSFDLPDIFEGLTVCACFNSIPVPLVNGECVIPSLEQGTAVLGVYAYKENEGSLELMYSPEPAMFCVLKGSFSAEVNKEAVPEISVYEQYCKMIKGEYEELQQAVAEAELLRENAEDNRKTTFETNESTRQETFELNERIRQAEFDGAYTNLLKNIAEESTTTDLPTQFPCHKIRSWYNKDSGGFTANAGYDCYLFEVSEGDRLLISNYITTSAMGSSMACVVDENFTNLYNFNTTSSKDLLGGLYAMPENARYVALNTPSGSSVPNVTLADESVIKTECVAVPCTSKFIVPQMNATSHLCYEGAVGNTVVSKWGISTTHQYANGIYPLQSGVEYVLHIPSLLDTNQYYGLAFFCDADFVVNKVIQQITVQQDFDENNRFVFTASENDKYIVINTYDCESAQFGENRAENICKSINIGDAVFDGKHDITLKGMGIVDRSIKKKFIAYGDSITLGVGIAYARGVKRWTEYLVERYNIPEHINLGVGYSSLAMKEKYSETPMSHDDRLNSLIAESPDIVTILGGANDYIFNIPIGTDEDVTNKNRYTFKGAYAYIIDKLLSAKPDTVILLLGMFTNAVGMYGEGKGAYPLKAYATATKEIAEYYGLPFVDLNECGFNQYNFNDTNGIFSSDGIHPNAEGTKRIAMVVSRWFDAFKGSIY